MHLKRYGKHFVTSVGNIVLDFIRVNLTAILEDDSSFEFRTREIGKTGDEIIFFQSPEDEFEARIVLQEKVQNQIFGEHGVDVVVADGRISRFTYDDQGLSITVSEATHFMNETVEILLLDNLFDCLKDFQGPCCTTTGGCTDENDGDRILLSVTPKQLGLFSESLKG
jgi:hypothetical protein